MDNQLLHRVLSRTTVLYAVVLIIGAIFIARLFYLQIVKHDFYKAEATSEQESKFVIPATRGQIYAMDGDFRTPIVLNQNLPTLFADPTGIEDVDSTAFALAEIIDMKADKIKPLLVKENTRYSVIQKKVRANQAKKIEQAELPGIGLADANYRVYPQNGLASQILGFVNEEGTAQYGIEEALDDSLKGDDGRLKAITDVYGIPLSSQEENIVKQPVPGSDVTLTIDINIQKHVESVLKQGVERTGGDSGSAIVMDPHTGAILAMANYPTFSAANFSSEKDFTVFQNDVVSRAYETGSGMKVFTMAAGLNEGVVNPSSTYKDLGYVQVDDRRIENAEGGGGLVRTMTEVIQKSVNTGVVHVLKQLGGGDINDKARNTLHDYFTEEFGFAKATGIAQPNEAAGQVFDTNTGAGDNVRYANMTFGQGMTVTMLQMASAMSSIVNGGDYFQPYLVQTTTIEGEEVEAQPQILRGSVISEKVSKDLRSMMKRVVDLGGGFSAKRTGYFIGGKTGTAQVLDQNTGEYSEFREIGSFIGFGGRTLNTPEYVIMTRVDEPTIGGYAGSVAAAPIFADISNFMIEYYQIPPN